MQCALPSLLKRLQLHNLRLWVLQRKWKLFQLHVELPEMYEIATVFGMWQRKVLQWYFIINLGFECIKCARNCKTCLESTGKCIKC